MEQIRGALERFLIVQSLKRFVDKIREPAPGTLVNKDECCYTFDTSESPGGLFINMNTYLCFGEEFAKAYSMRSGNNVFLHIKKEKLVPNVDPNSSDVRQPTRLAIGLKDGFSNTAPKYRETHKLVVVKYDDIIELPPSVIPYSINILINDILAEKVLKNEVPPTADTNDIWDGEIRKVSKYSDNLIQLDPGKKIPKSNWKCEKCDLTENLWMNLTDGAIHCGRKFFDGSGGNDHALAHFVETGYPLAVKLGTIGEFGQIDVFSYSEDDMVIDTNLEQHLAHFGINIKKMKKTDKTMVELELELNRKDREWFQYNKKDGIGAKILTGPGLTGMINMGNTCYINSVMQVLFSMDDFRLRFTGRGAKEFFNEFPPNPMDAFKIQMAKLGNGLWSGKYSKANDGIKPTSFKSMIGQGHPDYGSKQQQDAYLFFLYVMDLLQFNFKGLPDPGDALRFCLEERIECTSSKKVKYSLKPEITLQLEIPLHKAVNLKEVQKYEEKMVKSKTADTESEIVRYKIPFRECLKKFFSSELIEQFYSSAVNAETSATKRLRMATMPDYLIMHMKKFSFDDDWNPHKLDVSIQMPDEINLEEWRGVGLRPGEDQLSSHQFTYNFAIIKDLLQMGYSPDASMRALYITENKGLTEATNWLMDHSGDRDIEEPFVLPGNDGSSSTSHSESWNKFFPNPNKLFAVMSFGYNENQATRALDAANGNIELAKSWLENHVKDLEDMSSPILRNGPGIYKLVAFISHMGPSCQNGHYVAHILKGENWVMFNDERVTLSTNPQKDLGYMYLYKRED